MIATSIRFIKIASARLRFDNQEAKPPSIESRSFTTLRAAYRTIRSSWSVAQGCRCGIHAVLFAFHPVKFDPCSPLNNLCKWHLSHPMLCRIRKHRIVLQGFNRTLDFYYDVAGCVSALRFQHDSACACNAEPL